MKFTFKNFIILMSIIFIVGILLDLLFNFSGNLNENFESQQSELENIYNSNTTNTDNSIKSIQSLFSPDTNFNVHNLDGTDFYTIKVNSLESLSWENNQLVFKPTNSSESNQLFRMKKIESLDDIEGQVNNANMEFPYVILLAPNSDNLALKIGDSGYWIDELNHNHNHFKFKTLNTSFTPVKTDEDTIKINIKLDQESINKIIDQLDLDSDEDKNNSLNNNSNSNNASFSNFDEYVDCTEDHWIPKDAVRSLCRSCEPDLIV